MATRVKRHTDKSSRRLSKLEREIKAARVLIAELQASIIVMNALSCSPRPCLESGFVRAPEEAMPVAVGQNDAAVIPFQPRETAAEDTGDATVIPFRSRT